MKRVINFKSAAWVVVLAAMATTGCRHSGQGYDTRRGVYDVVSDTRQSVRFVPRRQAGPTSTAYEAPRRVVREVVQQPVEVPVQVARYEVEAPAPVPQALIQERYTTGTDAASDLELPPAKPGECYARVFIPPQYETITEEMLVQEAGAQVEVIPAEYEWVEDQVLVQEESRTLAIVPAEYNWVETQVMVSPATRKTVAQEALYDWAEEEVLVKEAHTVWKKGVGLSEELDNGTGEILCLVEVPAEYKTVRKKVLIQPAGVRTVDHPAEYKTVRKKVMVSPPRTVEEVVPAVYETLQVQRLKSEAFEKQIPVPPQYETVSRERQVSQGKYSWKRVLCETNLTPDILRQVQRSLQAKGYNPGPVDGLLGGSTLKAIGQYQDAHRLASGGLTYETLEHLGVR